MQKSHVGASEMDIAMLHRSAYLNGRRKNRKKTPMFDLSKTDPLVVDTLQIENAARQMRAEFIAQSVSALGQKIARLFTNTAGTAARG